MGTGSQKIGPLTDPAMYLHEKFFLLMRYNFLWVSTKRV